MSFQPCPHRPPCPGCPRFGEIGIPPTVRERLEQLARAHGLGGVPVTNGAAAAFRLRARLAIRGRVGSPKVGLFEFGTHRVVHIPHCIVHHPLVNRVAGVVRRAIAEARISPYSDQAHLGLARHLQVVVERRSQRAQVVLVANSESADPLRGCLEMIRERLGDDLHSLWFNAQCERSNTVLGPTFLHCGGPASVVERFGGAEVHYPPGAFGQNNLDMAEQIIAYLRGQLPAEARLTELYAGVGAIGLSLLDQVKDLRLNEAAEHSLRGLELGIAALDAARRRKVSILPGEASARALEASAADVLIVDPPRKGLGETLAERLGADPPRILLYVSCGLDSFIEDTRRLLGAGRLQLTSLAAFDLFSYTEHAEIVARFERI